MVLSASKMSRSLTKKYNVLGLRYISNPAITYCDPLGFNDDNWKHSAVNSFVEKEKGIKAQLMVVGFNAYAAMAKLLIKKWAQAHLSIGINGNAIITPATFAKADVMELLISNNADPF